MNFIPDWEKKSLRWIDFSEKSPIYISYIVVKGIKHMDLFAVANAAETAAPAQEAAGFGSMIILVVVFIAVMYFVTVLPNKKAMKEKQNLLSQIAVGDEVQIRSGICGKLLEYKQDSEFAVIEISKGVPVTINKDYIMNVLPKGTISSLK